MITIRTFDDPKIGVRGWLAYDGDSGPLWAGGCRVWPGLSAEELAGLSGRMTLKQRVLGLNVGGAKCGLDLDPGSADKPAALRGFLSFLRDELHTRFSMGSDMGTGWDELQLVAASVGIPSIKYAIRHAQGVSDDDFFTRMAQLDKRVGLLTLSQRRAGHALGHAVLAAGQAAGPQHRMTCALQGFGTLGRAAACTLFEEGVRVVAIADEHGCVADPAGLDVPRMLAHRPGTPVPQMAVPGARLASERLFELPADVLALAGCADAMDGRQVAGAQFSAVAVGANYGLSDEAEQALHDRGTFVVPDFIGGIGGSASMEALFGPATPPSAPEVLGALARIMRDLVAEVAEEARRFGDRPREAALRLAERTKSDPDAPPYGACPYLASSNVI